MGPRAAGTGSRFVAFVDGLVSVIGHADRAGPLRDYCTGLVMPCERKSVEPMAAVTAPANVGAQHQSLLHFVGEAPWSDERVSARWCCRQSSAMGRSMRRYDDTGFPKQGRHSVGVARQYCGQLGKRDNCQVAVSLSIANHHASLPVAYQLYLPKDWARIAPVGARRVCPRRSASKPSHRSRLSTLGVRGCPAARRGIVGRRLRRRHRSACEHHDAGVVVRSRHYAEHDGLGARYRAVAAEEMVGPRTTAEADPPGRQTSAEIATF